eukprot:6751062-Alexandrium_andersonii.AAC.1
MASKGAEEAWYEAGLEAEHCALEGTRMDATCFDLYKCFDTLPREVLYTVLAKAGLPVPILTAYASYHEGLR